MVERKINPFHLTEDMVKALKMQGGDRPYMWREDAVSNIFVIVSETGRIDSLPIRNEAKKRLQSWYEGRLIEDGKLVSSSIVLETEEEFADFCELVGYDLTFGDINEETFGQAALWSRFGLQRRNTQSEQPENTAVTA